MIRPPNCIIVGNGSSLLAAEFGADIDAHGCVVRFNAFELAGYEKHTGLRCDVWFNVTTHPSWRDDVPWKKIYVHSWERDASKCKTLAAYPQAEKIRHESLELMSLYAETDYRYWSTGAIAVWTMLQDFYTVTLTGFDWWDRAEHHYNDKAVRGTLHKPEIEREFFRKLAADGRLRWL